MTAIIMPTMRLLSNLGYVAVAMLGGYLVTQGRLNVGEIQAFIQYLRSFQQPLMNIANITNILQQTAAASERVFEFLNEPEVSADAAAPKVLDKVEGKVEFRNVHLATILKNPSLRTSLLPLNQGNRSPSSVQLVLARPPWSSF